jgi:hypothetical protein
MLGDAADPETLVVEGGVVGNPRWRALAHLSGTGAAIYPKLGRMFQASITYRF